MNGAVFFDLDGTLAHTAPDMLSALNVLRAEGGMKPLTGDEVRLHISAGATFLLREFVFSGEEDVQANRSRYLSLYEQTGYRATELFDGISDMLKAIRDSGAVWGIVTNKPLRYAKPVVTRLGLDNESACLICPDHCIRPKPAADPLLLAMEQIGFTPEQCSYVGDDVRDFQAAQAAGMRFIGAGWGYWSVKEEGIAVAESPSQLAKMAVLVS